MVRLKTVSDLVCCKEFETNCTLDNKTIMNYNKYCNTVSEKFKLMPTRGPTGTEKRC